ncbi:MAG: CAP domain-containing protein [Anaerolineae bacterium]
MQRPTRFPQLLLGILLVALALMTVEASANGQTARVYIPSVQRNPPTYADQVIALVNQERASRGIPRLDAHPALMDAAAAHSLDMASTGAPSHTGSDGSDPDDRMRSAGYNPSYWGECVAAGYPTPAEVVAGWMNSPSHRGILLSRDYVHIGAGYAHSDAGGLTHFWTVDVASPG